MKVAIIGAGISGLACAFRLYKYGIKPTIFEQKSWLGETLDLPAVKLNMFNTPINDPLKYLKKQFDIPLKPHYQVERITTFTPYGTYFASGNMGVIFRRGYHAYGPIVQVYRLFEPEILYNTRLEVEDIKDEFDAVVVASSSLDTAKRMNNLTKTFDSWVRIAEVKGSFDTDSIKIWFNTEYANNGYAYLVPFNEKEARLILVVTKISPEQLDDYWNRFLFKEGLTFEITDIKDIQHYLGEVSNVRVGNIYFVGHSGGMIDTVLGFGMFNSAISGALAGEAIAHNIDYRKLISPIKKDLQKKHELRKIIDTFDNEAFDTCVSRMHKPIVKQIIYANPFFRVAQAWPLAKACNLLNNR